MTALRTSQITIAMTLLALMFALVGCKKEPVAKEPPPPTVEVVTVEQKDRAIYREWVGTLEGEINATISAQVTGYLISQQRHSTTPSPGVAS